MEDSGETAPPPSRRTILLADDDADSRAIYGILFEVEGFDVLHAPDGPSAVETVRLRKPDLVLLNLFLPRMSGHQVLRALRSERATEAIPCLMFTGDARYEQMGMALIHGADGFVTKPAEPRAVLRIVQKLLDERRTG